MLGACGDDRAAVPDADALPLAADARRAADEHVCPVSPKDCVRFVLIETSDESRLLRTQAERLERDAWMKTLTTNDRVEYESSDVAVRVERLDPFLRDFRSTLRDGGAWKQGSQDFAARTLQIARARRPALIATLSVKSR